MNPNGPTFTATNLLAIASDLLTSGKYHQIDEDREGRWKISNARLFEDNYGVVAVVVYETWHDLMLGWVDAQASLVEIISEYMTSTDAKAWEGYLVLLTPSPVSLGGQSDADQIRYNTNRVRKLLAAGDDMNSIEDVNRVLLPLLPPDPDLKMDIQQTGLEMLPAILSKNDDIPEEPVRVAIEAFNEQKSMVESLHDYLKGL